MGPKAATAGRPQVFVAPSLWARCHSRPQGQRIEENPEIPALVEAMEGGADGKGEVSQRGVVSAKVHRADVEGAPKLRVQGCRPPEERLGGGARPLGVPVARAFLRGTERVGP